MFSNICEILGLAEVSVTVCRICIKLIRAPVIAVIDVVGVESSLMTFACLALDIVRH